METGNCSRQFSATLHKADGEKRLDSIMEYEVHADALGQPNHEHLDASLYYLQKCGLWCDGLLRVVVVLAVKPRATCIWRGVVTIPESFPHPAGHGC